MYLPRRRGPRGQPYRGHALLYPPSKRRLLIASPWLAPLSAMTLAAVQLQKRVRGYLARRRPAAAPAAGRRRKKRRAPQLEKYLAAKRDGAAPGNPNAAAGFAPWCASRVQAWWRGVQPRDVLLLARYSMYQLAAHEIQSCWREHVRAGYMEASVAQFSSAPSPQEGAARALQGAWRNHTNVRIFRYYRDLIQFRLAGDPASLLKTINPAEAYLFDKAAGVRVRFRLGGQSFPPVMFYKIFLHGPMCDVGAFAPRDYTEERQLQAKQLHNHGPDSDATEYAEAKLRVGSSYFGASVKAVGPTGTANWYKRSENNEWRPITMRQLAEHDPHMDALTKARLVASDPSFGKAFHYSTTVRAGEREQKRKRKKRNWMMKMYTQGRADEEAAAAPGPGGEDGGGGGGLDYDAYVANWHAVATSGTCAAGGDEEHGAGGEALQ